MIEYYHKTCEIGGLRKLRTTQEITLKINFLLFMLGHMTV